MNKVSEFIKSILIPVVIGGIVGFLISNFIDYNIINKPPLSPPSIVFPIIWTILYILMGTSYGILKTKGLIDDETNMIYYTQLLVNVTWPIVFFVFKWRFVSILWIILLLILVVYMTIKFYRKNKIACF